MGGAWGPARGLLEQQGTNWGLYQDSQVGVSGSGGSGGAVGSCGSSGRRAWT